MLTVSTEALEPIDGYYSNDLLGAIDEAKERPHHYDYSNTFRYKRTTAQSINLNPININDLEETHLSMNHKKNNTESEVVDPVKFSLNNEIFNPVESYEQTLNIQPAALVKNSTRSISLSGELSSSNILNNSSIHSTPRP